MVTTKPLVHTVLDHCAAFGYYRRNALIHVKSRLRHLSLLHPESGGMFTSLRYVCGAETGKPLFVKEGTYQDQTVELKPSTTPEPATSGNAQPAYA